MPTTKKAAPKKKPEGNTSGARAAAPEPSRKTPGPRGSAARPNGNGRVAARPTESAADALEQMLGSREEAEELLDPETALPHLKKRVAELELGLAAAREEIETLQASFHEAQALAAAGAPDWVNKLAVLAAVRDEVVSLSAKLSSMETSLHVESDSRSELAARLEVMEAGGLRQLVGRLATLEAVDRALMAPVPWETALSRALSVVCAQFAAAGGVMFLLEPDGANLRVAMRYPPREGASETMKLVASPSVSTAYSDRTLATAPLSREEAFLGCLGAPRESEPSFGLDEISGSSPGAGTGHAFAVPLIVSQRPRGAVAIAVRRDGPLSPEDQTLLSELVSRVALAFESEVTRRKHERTQGGAE